MSLLGNTIAVTLRRTCCSSLTHWVSRSTVGHVAFNTTDARSIDETEMTKEVDSESNNSDNYNALDRKTYATKFFDNFVVVTGEISKCFYQIDNEGYIYAARFDLWHSPSGPMLKVSGQRKEIIQFMVRNMEEGTRVRVKGKISHRTRFHNISIEPFHIDILEQL